MTVRNRSWKTKSGATRVVRLYGVWGSLKDRCLSVANKDYRYYGGRGIKICDEWRNSFDIFRAWATANGYRKGLTIDRLNNDGNYDPSNCQWVTRSVQNANKRTAFGSGHCRAKLHESDIIVIRELLSVGLSRRHAAEFFDVSVPTIQGIAENRTWRHV